MEIGNQVALAVGNMMSYQEIAALNTKVEHTAERYRTLLEINNAIITNLSQEALLHAISKVLSRVIPFDRAAFTLYIPEQQESFAFSPSKASRRHRIFEPGRNSIRKKASPPGFLITSGLRCAATCGRSNTI